MHPRFRDLHPYSDEPRDAYSGFDHYLPFDGADDAAPDRLMHLVLVDGRLVDVWSEPTEGTRWQQHADRIDRERRLAQRPPEKPLGERVLEWLDGVCGGREAVLALTAAPLTSYDEELPPLVTPGDHDVVRATLEHLEMLAERRFGDEVGVALRRALLRAWAIDPHSMRELRSVPHAAGGVAWVVGRANALLGPTGVCNQRAVATDLGLGNAGLAGPGRVVERTLLGFREPPYCPSVVPGPRIEPLGHADLLVGRVRAGLVVARDRALEVCGPQPSTALP